MTTGNGKSECITCGKEKRAVRCEGCLQLFCYDHLTEHRQELIQQLDHIQLNCDFFRQTLIEQTNHPQIHLLTKQIDQWEQESINKIQQTASECKHLLNQHTTKNIHHIKINLAKLIDQLKKIRQENDFNEIDLNQINQKLNLLTEELHKLSNVSIQPDLTPFINKISLVVSSGKSISSMNNHHCTKWKQYGSTVAGGYGCGNQLYQLSYPDGIYFDDDNEKIYIADSSNHRIVEWKCAANHGEIIAGGNKQGNRMDQLNQPTHVIVDKNSDYLIICDRGNKRVLRCSRQNETQQQTMISNIDCSYLAMDNNGDLYVSDKDKHDVTRWKRGDTHGTVVAGGNGKGGNLNQLYHPTYLFVDEDYSVYISDCENHRVMKWMKGEKEGMIVAGGQGEGNTLSQLSSPTGIIVDHLGNIYVADCYNHRIMRWSPGAKEGNIVVGGNGRGKQPNQFSCPTGLSFDQENNLYVVDWGNHRVQKFDVDVD